MNTSNVVFKCKKCRNLLFSESFVCTVHGEPVTTLTDTDCNSKGFDGTWYLKENCVTEWMKTQFDEENWIKGKLLCPKCNSRIGSFNFVSGHKCSCGLGTVPPVHVVKAKVDWDMRNH